MDLFGRVLVPGDASGTLLRLRSPISFWGGVDPRTGIVSDPRHPNYGDSITDTVLIVPATAGSSSSSAIMLELLRSKLAPAALLLARHDGILALGVLVARELGYGTIPVVEVTPKVLQLLPEGGTATVTRTGSIEFQ
jgi:predicted aconitase with swiveling domain